ncbi:carbon-nitrogen hydrolase family protein [Rhizobium sp. 16-449-1b]|uniref:carbon-nitrogen hydrolase family protein n=1 Tax=Rhizobium sp. 16-449-1b TaxID=2819989 RepID=UPI001ADAACB3|nr:carbon-nitrogen hydrolase family protein [Rhizobium sp. 16-449-1b]MBO9195976.1 carbon-nitrogen hydrolase family protein [Rhizobium sp. 16-449-1b]
MKAIKAAAVQAAPVYLDLHASISKAERIVAEASENGAKLVAFPETWLPGYPFFAWLGSPADSIGHIPEYHANSMELRSPEMLRLQTMAARYGVTLVMGYSEREGGSRYMSQVIIGEHGEILLNRRKLKPTLIERTIFGEGDGSDLVVVDSAFGRLGALNCWEHMQPLVKMAMFAQHEEVHVASWPAFSLYRELAYALGPEVNNGASRQYAVEGSAFVLAPCAIIDAGVFDKLATSSEKAMLLNPQSSAPGGGFAQIYAPDGRAMCEPIPQDQEGILYADLDPSVITISKAAADPAGHYSRPDVLKLVLNRESRRVMEEVGRPNHAGFAVIPLEEAEA